MKLVRAPLVYPAVSHQIPGAIRIALGDRAGRKRILEALALNPHFDVTGAAEARSLAGADGGP